MSRRGVLAVFAAGALATIASPARAAWDPPQIASFNGAVQGSGYEVALSAAGDHVVFTSAAYGLLDQPAPPGFYRVGGLFRRDLRAGTVDLVVPGALYDAATDQPTGRGAGVTPSVSADGSHVAFVTRDGLVPQDTNDVQDVYVRDMAVPLGLPGAFELVSARDGTDAPIAWEPGGGGARLTHAGGAISADGRRVVFATGAAAAIEDGGAVLPAGQVLVRDLDTRATTLVTREIGTGAAAGGGEKATISGDGNVVAWVGTNGPAQARFAAGEDAAPDLPWILWRRLSDPLTTPAARVAAAGDPDVAGCGSLEAGGPACAGFFDVGFEAEGFVAAPALSSDGRRVAFVTSLRPRAVQQLSELGAADAYLAEMAPPRAVAGEVREITREGESSTSIEQSSPVVAVGLSADGGTMAFTTARTRLRLSSPVLIGDPPAPGLTLETYAVDLAADSVELVSRAADGGKAIGNELGTGDEIPKLSADGRRVAFSSSATNLIAGDVNGLPDAFTVSRPQQGSEVPPQQFLPAAEPASEPSPDYVLRAVGRARRDGTVRIDARIPGGGVLGATATSRASGRTARVARLTRRAGTAGNVRVVLRPAARWRRVAARVEGLPLRVSVSFTPRGVPFAGRRPLRRTLRLRLRMRKVPSPSRRARAAAHG